MRLQTPQRILGIDPGTRFLGTAVIEHRELVHHDVSDIAERNMQRSLSSVRRVVSRLIDAYRPRIVTIERTFFSKGRNAPLLRLVTDEVRAQASDRALKIVMIAPSTAKKIVAGSGHASKDHVARAICAVYPQLRAYIGFDRKWKTRYHSNMFDAIAVALVAAQLLRSGSEHSHTA